ncbi:MAG TPA: cell division topological specificity factor MinE [Ktedonobacterales bacterium]|nr:cell division topological specificity factor MinE [Ktedonobacterales bacterium]
MGLFDKLFGRKKQPAPSTSELARERLTLMLVHDRLKLTPDLLDRIKGELLEVISKYVEIDETGVDVELTHTEHSDKLVARMPVRRQRIHFERDVLEPGMGNPIVAATALAKIHQPPAEVASAAAASGQETVAPSGDAPPAAPTSEAQVVSAATPAAQESPAPATSAAPAVTPPSDAPTDSAEKEAPTAASAEPSAAKEPAAPGEPAAEKMAEAVAQPTAEAAAATAETDQKATEAAQASPTKAEASSAAPEPPAPSAEAGPPSAGGGTTASANEGSVSVETPASAATPTKG